ncbi:DNA-binding transcriptional regulator, XRE family [Lachnospiraceae bacterium G41]|nr:DNA-binding transcriptional regulator, XRE family [Lachnospiraceae bacterium G41]
MIIYNRLWSLLEEKNISQYKLIKMGISPSVLDRLKHNQGVTTDTIDKLCTILDCNVEDIMNYTKDNNHS